MHESPDGREAVATVLEAVSLTSPPLLVLDLLRDYMDRRALGTGPLRWSRIGEGHSNITYLIRRGDESFVLRRGPRPPYPDSAHDMIREARVQRILGSAGIPVPDIVAVCDDESVLGVPFYIMDYIEGVVITDSIPSHLDAADQRAATTFAAVDGLVALHSLDASRPEIRSIGRADGYLERQIRRFSSLWASVTRRSLPEVEIIRDWLARSVPSTQRTAVVHGDYRIGNLMYSPDPPARVSAILDWEMATIGDPLADLGYFVATYATRPSRSNPMELTSVTGLPGYPTRGDIVSRYAAATGLDLSNLDWYQVLALWKAAVFCEAIYVRWQKGQRPNDAFGPTLRDGVPALLRDAQKIIHRA